VLDKPAMARVRRCVGLVGSYTGWGKVNICHERRNAMAKKFVCCEICSSEGILSGVDDCPHQIFSLAGKARECIDCHLAVYENFFSCPRCGQEFGVDEYVYVKNEGCPRCDNRMW